jgi:hypothetical protein
MLPGGWNAQPSFLPFALGFGIRALPLRSSYCTSWATVWTLSTLAIFEIGSPFCPGPLVFGITDVHHHIQLFFLLELGSHKLFCLAWPRTTILVSAIPNSQNYRCGAVAPSLCFFSPLNFFTSFGLRIFFNELIIHL